MSQNDEFDIGKLLAVALDDTPPRDLTKRVMARLAGVKTAVEFGRLLGVAPISPLLDVSEDENVSQRAGDDTQSTEEDRDDEYSE